MKQAKRADQQTGPTRLEAGASPVSGAERVINLDTARGIATLGILIMNAVAFGRMALTNYLTQTVIGITLFQFAIGTEVTRTGIAVFVLAVWALQLAWSPAWLRRFRYGPAEWAWRCGTYRRIQPLRRRP